MAKVLVVGGFGYLGSIVTDLLSTYKHEVDVCDLCLFDNYFVKDCIKFEKYYDSMRNVKDDYDFIIWSANIDVPTIYPVDKFCQVFLRQSHADFLLARKKAQKNFINLSTFHLNIDSTNQQMQHYLKNLEKETTEVKGCNIRFGSIYGPSPRMRWDTHLNKTMLSCLQGAIQLEDDWPCKIPTVNVLDAAHFVIAALEHKCEKYEFFTNQNSILENAYYIKSYLNPKCEVIVDEPKWYMDNVFESSPGPISKGIKDACLTLKQNLENNTNPDFANDIFNNEIMLEFALKTFNLARLLGT